MSTREPHVDCARIYELWHQRARAGDVAGLLELYAPEATIESPLIPTLLDTPTGVCRGHEELRRFFEEGTRRRPNALVRWHRTGVYFWEYPRQTPSGDQIDIAEFMQIEAGKICAHRIYWGWFGIAMLQRSAARQRASLTESRAGDGPRD